MTEMIVARPPQPDRFGPSRHGDTVIDAADRLVWCGRAWEAAGMAARQGRDFIARHGETVFNAAGRMQGDGQPHTPLTRAGFAQAEAIGAALLAELGPRPALTLWSSPTGRALQTLSMIAEQLDLDWHGCRTDDRLVEIGVGSWSGLSYAEVIAAGGPVIDPASGLFARNAPDGEWYDAIAARLSGWLADTADDPGDRLVVMHGISSRVLRGLLTGAPVVPVAGVPVAPALPQGSIVAVADGRERVLHQGAGVLPA